MSGDDERTNAKLPEAGGFRANYQSLFEHAPVAQLVTRASGWVLEANDQAKRLLGGELVGSRLGARLQLTHRLYVERALQETAATPSSVEVVLSTGEPVVMYAAAVTGGVFTDRRLVAFFDARRLGGDRERAETEREILRRVVSVTPCALLSFMDERVEFANEAATRLLGRIGGLDALLERVAGGEQDQLRAAFDERTGQLEVHLRNAAGEPREVDVLIQPIDAVGRRRVVTLNDLTDERLARAETERASRLQSLGLLVAGVGHEISNPLAFIIPALEEAWEQLSDCRDPSLDSAAHLVEEALGGLERIGKIVSELRTHVRATASAGSKIDLNATIAESIDLARSRISVSATIELDLGRLPPLPGPAVRLGQVALNFVLNATNAMPPRPAAENRILVRTFTDRVAGQTRVFLEVIDNGSGIAADVLPSIFDPFFSRSKGGTGLGLAVSRQIVGSLGGDIEVASTVGEGTTFSVHIPVESRVIVSDERLDGLHAVANDGGPELGAQLGRADGGRSAANERHGTLERLQGESVLLVEDDDMVCKAIARRFLRGVDVRRAREPRQAIDMLRNGPKPFLIITDWMMNGGTGGELLHWIRKSASELAGRVIVVSGLPSGVIEEEFPDVPVVAKPVQRDELMRAIDACVGRG